MKLTPMADRVLLKPTEAEETTASGIILALHGHIPANGERPDAVLCPLFFTAPQLGAHAKGKLLHLDMKELCEQKMSCFMQNNNDAKNQNGKKYGFQ